MTILQVPSSFVRSNIKNPDLYRISMCDDGNYGHSHKSARIKPLKNLTMEEFADSIDNPSYGFVMITVDGLEEIV